MALCACNNGDIIGCTNSILIGAAGTIMIWLIVNVDYVDMVLEDLVLPEGAIAVIWRIYLLFCHNTNSSRKAGL